MCFCGNSRAHMVVFQKKSRECCSKLQYAEAMLAVSGRGQKVAAGRSNKVTTLQRLHLREHASEP